MSMLTMRGIRGLLTKALMRKVTRLGQVGQAQMHITWLSLNELTQTGAKRDRL